MTKPKRARKTSEQAEDRSEARRVIEKLRGLRQEQLEEIEDFVDSLHQREEGRALTVAAGRLSERSFEKVWENPDDSDYDKL